MMVNSWLAFSFSASIHKKFIFLFILIIQCCNFYSCQNQDNSREIDRLLSLSDSYINVDFEKSLLLSKKALAKAEQTDDSEKKAMSYYYVAKSLVFFRRFDECSSYLEKGFQEKALKQNIILKASFLNLQASYYGRMSFADKAYQNYFEILNLLKDKTDLESKLIISNTYKGLADYYTDIKNYKKAHFYADKSIAVSESIPTKEYLSAKRIYRSRAFIYFYKSWIYLQENKPDLAYPFVTKGYNQAVDEKYKYLAPFYEVYGDYYFQTNDYKSAIDFYVKSAANKNAFKHYSAYVDTKIAESYKMLGNSQKEIYYLKKAESRHKEDLLEEKKIVQQEMNRVLNKNEAEKNDLIKNNILISLFIIFVFAVVLLAVILRYRTIRMKKRKIIGEHKIRLSEKESEIKEIEEKVEKLQQKITESFSELSDLVKNNSSLFWGRFQEVYPDFCSKMLKIGPALKISELMVCAYIYMGFSTKEIAEYTFKASKTIENVRYNLRKKLGLSPEEDLKIWIRKYIDRM